MEYRQSKFDTRWYAMKIGLVLLATTLISFWNAP